MKLRIFLIIIAAALLHISCDDFLDRNPLDKPSSGTFWKTEADFDQALTACYGNLQSDYFSLSLPIWDNMTDNSYSTHDYGTTSAIVQGNITPTTGGMISSIYTNAFSGIARVNTYLQNLSNFTGMADAKKKQNEAEARMIRAYFYSFLYRCYGEVPVVREPVTLDNQFQAKKPAAEVMALIIEDLDFAIANLQNITYSASKGRWTVNAAKAYKARMLLYDAYDSNGSAIITQMNAIKPLLSDISGYTLAPDFVSNFDDLKQETSPEIMMSVKWLAPNNSSSADQYYNEWVRVAPLPNLISMYTMKDGSPANPVPYKEKGAIETTLFTNDSLDTREPRAARYFFINRYRVGENSYPSQTTNGAGLYKFTSSSQTPPFGYSTTSQQDWIILRYADVLLMRAEVENEISGPTDAVYADVDAIRTRLGLPGLPAGLNKEGMREKIRDERRMELAFEGSRYFDLKRWKIAKQVLNNVKDGMMTYKFEDKHYLWPLPQTEIDKAGGILVQNPDYK